MKNQNDLIITIVAIVIALGVSATFFFTKREPVKPADPTPVPTATAALQPGKVVSVAGLPGGGTGGPTGGGMAGAGGMRKVMPGAAGMPGAPGGPGGMMMPGRPGGPGMPSAPGAPGGGKKQLPGPLGTTNMGGK